MTAVGTGVLPPDAVADYRGGRTSFIVGLAPSDAVHLGVDETVALLRARFGEAVDLALRAGAHPLDTGTDAERAALRSPVADLPDGRWLQRANIVGVNVRTLPDVWSLVPYALTLPAIQDVIHLLPILEPGVVSSLYAPTSWQLDPAIRSGRLAAAYPELDTAERQMRAIVHLLHVMGRAVGMDVIPHTDRFAEMVLAQPDHFEWLERRGSRITRHGAAVAADVEAWIVRWVNARGPVVGGAVPGTTDGFFRDLDEPERLLRLFGRPEDHDGRRERRIGLIRDLHPTGFETAPATMAPPYRGLEVDPRPEATVVDELGLEWREFRIIEPTPQSRVFGPLTRFDLYEPAGDGWALDFERPKRHVWRYVAERYAQLVDRFGFDFMRGDMAHVQMRPDGVPDRVEADYDILGFVRNHVRTTRARPSFGYLAETFIVPPGTMAFGDELDHLEAADADSTLGDLQSVAVGDPAFPIRLRRYRDLLATRSVAPSFTLMTGDKDDPRFDAFYLDGNEVRLFLALLLPDMPSYMALGFEQRDPHPVPAPNEHYTKLYVFHQTSGRNATDGPYVWGSNRGLLERLTRIRAFADGLRDDLGAARVAWLRPPDATGAERLLAWVLEGVTRWLCVANLDGAAAAGRFGVPGAALGATPTAAPRWRPAFSTAGPDLPAGELEWNAHQWIVGGLAPGEGRVYREERAPAG